MPFKPRTIIGILVGLAAVAGLLYVAFREDPVPVDLVAAKRDVMRVTVDADGKTRIKDIYEVSAPVSGTAQRSPVVVGDRWRKGPRWSRSCARWQPAFSTRAPAYRPRRPCARPKRRFRPPDTVRQAEEELNYAISQYSRIQTLVDRGVASLTQLEDAAQAKTVREAALDSAKAEPAAAESALARAKAALIEPGPPANGEHGRGLLRADHGAGRRRRSRHRQCQRAAGAGRAQRSCRSASRTISRSSPTSCHRKPCASRRARRSWSSAGAARIPCTPRARDRSGGPHQGLRAGHRGTARRCDDRFRGWRRHRQGARRRLRRFRAHHRLGRRGHPAGAARALFRDDGGWALFASRTASRARSRSKSAAAAA
jgi:hypothetical protein